MIDAGSEILKSKMERTKESEHSKLDEEEAVGMQASDNVFSNASSVLQYKWPKS